MAHTSDELPGVFGKAWNLSSRLIDVLYSFRLPWKVLLWAVNIHMYDSISQPNLINRQYFRCHISHVLVLKNISL
ncbi:MAG: hypothetical protein ABJQ14_09970, partial [Hyphomicrobiales bacterium]